MITDLILKELTSAVRDRSGGEVIGYLLESEQGVQVFYRIRNPLHHGEFFISSFELDRLNRFAQVRELVIRAFIHSHLSSCTLSDADIKQIREQEPPMPWIIVCIEKSGKLCYRIYDTNELLDDSTL